MIPTSYLVIVVTSVVAYLLSSLYYFGFNKRIKAIRRQYVANQYGELSSVSFTKVLVDLIRTFVLALVVAYAVTAVNIWFVDQALTVALWLWVGFTVVLLVGMVVHEKFPTSLAVIYAGDWLIKMVLFCVVFTAWRSIH